MQLDFIFSYKKGSFLASFFIIAIFGFNNLTWAQGLEVLAADKQWQALLHIPDKAPLISDANFVSQIGNASLIELNKGIEALSSTDVSKQHSYLCQFPARSLWLQKKMPELNRLEAKDICADFSDFLSHVPAEKISLIYAYENIDHPASMMGHIFLKLEGVNNKDIFVEHSISFYTDTMTLNLPKLLFDSLVIGKNGYFSVSPYQEQIRQYNKVEQRNVIEYELVLDDFSHQLMQYHIWELKDVELRYFFNRFNCATLINDLIGIASPAVLAHSTDWLSPLDVVKVSAQAGLLGESKLIASSSWKIRMLEETLAVQGIDTDLTENTDIKLDSLNKEQRFLLFSLEESYNDFLAASNTQQDPLSKNDIELLRKKWQVEDLHQFIELSGYKDPLTRPNDSQFNVLLDHQDNIVLEYIPTSHQLSDDNRSSFSESELQLLSFKGQISLRDNSTRFDEIGLYKMASFIPYDPLIGGISKRFSVGAKQELDENLEERFTAYALGGVGLSSQLHKDFLVYSLLNIQLEEANGLNVSYGPEVGFFFYEIFSQKTSLSYAESYNQRNSSQKIRRWKIAQSWFFDKDYSLILQYEHNKVADRSRESMGLELRYYY